MKQSCSERLLKALTLKNLTQSELCRKTGIPKSAMSQYVKGSFEPKQDRVYLIAKALDISEAWLMGYDVPMQKEKNPPEKNGTLSEGEEYLLELFRKIPDDKKQLAIEMLKAALKAN